jgi:Ni/Co efflux regulator RcnB
MNIHRIAISAVALLALTGSAVYSQERSRPRAENRESRTQFNDQDRRAAQDWYGQHKAHPPVGLRSRDRLSPDMESRLRPGEVLDPALRKRSHAVPTDLRRRLPPPPRNSRYVAVGGHVALVDNHNLLEDIIHLLDR